MLLHVYMDVNKDAVKALIFFSAFLDLQSIQDNEATTFKELIFLNALTDVPIISRKTRVQVANDLLRKHLSFSKNI